MVRGERSPSALLREVLLHPVPLEREVEKYLPILKQREEDTKGQPQEEHAESISCVVQIPITEITKRVNRQHLYKLLYRSLSHLPLHFMSESILSIIHVTLP
jgi:hypothetical protein